MFIDDTGAATNMVRRYGWSLRDEHLIAAASHGHRRTTIFVASLPSAGRIAPLVLDGPMANAQRFLRPMFSPSECANYIRHAGYDLK